MADFETLITPMTADEIEETILALLEAANITTTSWAAGSVIRYLVEAVSEVLADAWLAVATIARGSVLETAQGTWVDERLSSDYDETRTLPVRTVGRVLLTDDGGGPHTLVVGTHRFAATGGELVYRVSALPDGATLSLDGTLEVEVTAEAVGASYNVPNGAITEVVVSLPTVTVSNPAIGTTGTWITTLGADLESPAAAKRRASAKWATLSTGSPASAYLYWALSTTGVTRAKVDDTQPEAVTVYIDASGAVATLQATLDSKVPAGTEATASAATAQAVTVPATVTVRAAYRDSAEAAIVDALTEYAAEVDIGDTVREAEIVERIMSVDGVVDVVMETTWAGTPNVTLGSSSYPQFTLSLTYVEV